MKIDVMQQIKNFDGTVLLGPDGLVASDVLAKLASMPSIPPQELAKAVQAASVPLTLRVACCGAIMGVYKDETELSGQEKTRRYCLARKIYEDPCPDLASEDIALIKQLIAKRYYASVVGPAWQMLEGKQ